MFAYVTRRHTGSHTWHQLTALVEEGYGKYAGEQASKAERQWKERSVEGREAKEKIDRKDEVDFNSWDSKAGGTSISWGQSPPSV